MCGDFSDKPACHRPGLKAVLAWFCLQIVDQTVDYQSDDGIIRFLCDVSFWQRVQLDDWNHFSSEKYLLRDEVNTK